MIFLFALTGPCAFAQLSQRKPVNTAADNIVPPSAEAAALGKYAQIPVGLYTGTPQIDIPVWEIREGDITVPVSYSYHASGNKVEEIAPRTGMGWTLQAGGVITRTIMGEADELGHNGFIQFSMHHTPEDVLYGPTSEHFTVLNNLVNCATDAQPDQFSFNFAGHTGKFSFNWNTDINQKIDISCERKVIIKPIGYNPDPASTDFIQGWEITTDDGMKYIFQAEESIHITSQTGHFYPCRYDYPRVTSWYLTRITSPAGHVVSFEYAPYTLTYNMRTSETINHLDGYGSPENSISYETLKTNGRYLSRITTGSGNITLNFKNTVTARTDLPGYNTLYPLGEIEVINRAGQVMRVFKNTYTYATGRLTLESIQEYADQLAASKPPYRFFYTGTLQNFSQGQTVKIDAQDHWGFATWNSKPSLIPSYTAISPNGSKVPFEGANRDPSASGSMAGMLTKIVYPAGATTTFEYEQHRYSFVRKSRVEKTYEIVSGGAGVMHVSVPLPGADGHTRQRTKELFTVPLNIYTEPGTAPITFSYYGGYCSNDPGFNEAQLGPAARITDLSGNLIASFTYSSSNPSKSMGLDLTKLRPGQQYYIEASTLGIACLPKGNDYSDASVSWKIKTDRILSNSEAAGGVRIKRITDHDGISTDNNIVRRFAYTMMEGTEEVSSGVILSRPQYEYVTQMHYGDDFSPVVVPRYYTSRMSSSVVALGSTHGSHIGYRKVTVYEGENGEGGKTESYFDSFYELPDEVSTTVPFPPARSYDYGRGKLTQKIDHKYLGPGDFKVVRTITNSYDRYIKEIPAYKVGLAIAGGGPFGEGFMDRYAVGGYTYILAFVRVKQTLETVFDDNGFAHTIEKNFGFDPNRQFLLSETLKTSDGQEQVAHHYYPWQYHAGPSSFTTELTQRHMLGTPVETIVKQQSPGSNARVTAAAYRQYTLSGNTMVPSRELRFAATAPVYDLTPSLNTGGNFDNRYYTEVRSFDNYDAKANPRQISAPGNVITSYFWGYGNTYPVAQVVNSKIDACAYSGFETPEKGNWNYSDIPENYATDARTGKRSFKANASFVAAPGRWILSVWAKGSGTIKAEGSTRPIDGTWRRYQWLVEASSPREVLIETNGNLIDDLRLHPEGALMKSFTYEPGVGITSSTDENHATTFFEYDPFGRLTTVKDHEGNIVKHQQYHYKQN